MTSNSIELSANKRALLKIRELKQQLAAAEENQLEPIAVVSMACRFPRSASTPEKFWQQLVDKQSFVGDIPQERWDPEAFFDEDQDAPGKMYTQKGVYLDQIDQMDPEFFGISPREATWVDPQQRLLMEVSWEAMETAGWIPEEIGERTGVFVGWMHNDYQNEASDSFLNLNPYIATGAAGSFLCGRLAYYLGLHGPALAVDTACSSSLVALHLGIQSLQRKDCDRALVGGVNVICSPTTNILTCKLKALSPTGQSRAFDASADGYLRGEGCGVIAIRRLSDAERDGDHILGVIRGSAVGHNGFSSGLTAPNPKAQEMVIRQALERSGLQPQEIDYLEAHGTGTELGDPLEVQAAVAALCANRTADRPLLIGSVKTNIGHLEAAAGMAGLIKVLLSLQHDQIPGQLNFETPNPHIPWRSAAIEVLTDATDWPEKERRVAGVSAFGMSGTNAHVIIESHQPTVANPRNEIEGSDASTEPRPCFLTVTAKSEDALFQLVENHSAGLRQLEDDRFADWCKASQRNRSHFEHRAVVIANNRLDAISSLEQLVRSEADQRTVIGQAGKRFKHVWQFTGQGSQYPGMARKLFDTESTFRDAILRCEKLLAKESTGSSQKLTDVLFQDQDQIHDTRWTQPGIFAIQMGLSQLLDEWGVRPDLVLGHSVGQYAAACTAGIMSWDDGFRLISERGRLIGSLPSGGKMLAVFAPEEKVREFVSQDPDLDIGAYNVSHLVISGPEESIQKVNAELDQNGIRSKILQTSHAFHSRLMDPILDKFAQFADQVPFQTSSIPLVCNLTGKILPVEFQFSGKYWADQIRGAVRYQQSLETALQSDYSAFLELGPRPVLTGMGRALVGKDQPRWIHCLDEKSDPRESVLFATASLYTLGLNPDFNCIQPQAQSNDISLPTYPFQRRRFWGPDKPRAAHAEHHTAHPLLGGRMSLAAADNQKRYESFIDQNSPSWIVDHQVMGATVMPGSAFVELANEAARQLGKNCVLENLVFEKPLTVSSRTALQTIVHSSMNAEGDGPSASGKPKFLECFSHSESMGQWSRHFSVENLGELESENTKPVSLESIQRQFETSVDVEDFYSFLDTIDLSYGPGFQTIESLWQSDSAVLSRLIDRTDIKGYSISPMILDGAFHSLAVAIDRDGDEMFLPVAIGKIKYHDVVAEEVWCHAEWLENSGNIRSANLTLVSPKGELLLEIEELKVQRIDRRSIQRAAQSGPARLLFDFQWKRSRLAGGKLEKKQWWIIGSSDEALQQAAQLSDVFDQRGHRCQLVAIDSGTVSKSSPVPNIDVTIGPEQALDWSQVLSKLSVAQTKQKNDDPNSDEQEGMPDGIIWLLDHGSPAGLRDRVTERNADGLVTLVQWLRKKGVKMLNSGLQLVTGDALAARELPMDGSDRGHPSGTVNPTQSQYWGLGRVMAAECPEYRVRLIDRETGVSVEDATEKLADILLTNSEENQIAIRGNEYRVPRISKLQGDVDSTLSARENACYLITGGLGKLGRQAAKWLAEKGAGQLVLLSRREPDEETVEFLNGIRNSGTEVSIRSIDVADPESVSVLFEEFGQSLQPLGGIIHAAGVLDDGLIDNQNWDRFEKVLRPKIDAAWILHEASLAHQPDFFVLYSSVASILGSPGQSNYAMGNGYLDGLAAYRNCLGLPALSINWGPWTEGMADDEKIKKRLSVQGITPLEVNDAHAAMELALTRQVGQCFVIDVDWRKLKLGADGKTPLILSDLVASRKASGGGDSQLVLKLKKLAPAAQRDLMVETVQKLFQDVLGSETPPEIDRPLIEMGLDSLMAVEFGTSLQQAFGGQFEIGPSLLFDHPTIESIAEYLITLISDSADLKENEGTGKSTEAKSDSESIKEPVTRRDDVAIIGMSCRFPGADSLEDYWNNLLDGIDSVGEIPGDRWEIDRFFSKDREPGKMYTREGGFLKDIDKFDAAFFNISEPEACWIDPQHRMLLENSYHALEHAGIPLKPIPDPNVGVFMGIMGQDYAFLPTLDDREVVEGFEGAGLSHSAGVGRISYLLGLVGPSVSVDTASSSSLVAIIQAVRSLQEGNCNMALAGGVNAILAPVNSLLMSKAGLLAPDGRCKSFSEQADGFGRGEGCGVVVLKRLADAQKDGDRILAVIRGGAVGHNGFSGGLTTPSSKAQARVIDAAVKDARIRPSQVQYLEAHGTGTEFGDPIELTAATQIYGKGRPKDKPLIVGSAKANISHLEAAGGVSGLIKTVLALQHGVIPKQIHFEQPNRHIPWKRMPIRIPTEKVKWEEERFEFAAVTALGLAGTNAHVILSAPPLSEHENMAGPMSEDPDQDSHSEHQPGVLFVSAKSDYSLTHLLKDYHQLLGRGVDWPSVCHASAVSRQHLEVRECLVAHSRQEAIVQLESLIQSRGEPATNGAVSSDPNQPSSKGNHAGPGQKLFLFSGVDDLDWVRLQELQSVIPNVDSLLNSLNSRWQSFNSSIDLSFYSMLGGTNPQHQTLRQFVCYAILATIWKSWGLEPDGVAGFGAGHLVASHVADVLSLEDAFDLLWYLSQLDPDRPDWEGFEKQADQYNYYPPNLSLRCPMSGEEIPIHQTPGGRYWRDYFEQASSEPWDAEKLDFATYDVVLNQGSKESWDESGAPDSDRVGRVYHSWQPESPLPGLLRIVASLYRLGWDPDFRAIPPVQSTKKIDLPVYPFEKKRYWITEISQFLKESSSENQSQTSGSTHV